MGNSYLEHPVYKHFERIARIPHGSGNEKALSDYVKSFAEARGLAAVQDAYGNLVVRVAATAGFEAAPTVILQGHLDMVCEKNSDVVFDFEKDALRLFIDGDWLRAEGTTLGADDGVATAYMLALMDGECKAHPALELVMTVDEEVGLIGAAMLDAALLTGEILINLDSGEEGEFITSCAGGLKLDIDLPIAREAAPEGFVPLRLGLTGLTGGHSGVDIHRGRAHSVTLMHALLEEAAGRFGVRLASFTGGVKDNAIPREAEAVVFVREEAAEKALFGIQLFASALFAPYSHAGERIQLDARRLTVRDHAVCLPTDAQKNSTLTVLTEASAAVLLSLLGALPNGALAYSEAFPALVETSNNVGVVRVTEQTVRIVCAIRSSVAAQKAALAVEITAQAEAAGATVQTHGDYPAWEYSRDSRIRGIAVRAYSLITSQCADVTSVHAGLECGWFAEKIPGLDIIALGPTMLGIHSPQERLSLSSFVRTWELLKAILLEIKQA